MLNALVSGSAGIAIAPEADSYRLLRVTSAGVNESFVSDVAPRTLARDWIEVDGTQGIDFVRSELLRVRAFSRAQTLLFFVLDSDSEIEHRLSCAQLLEKHAASDLTRVELLEACLSVPLPQEVVEPFALDIDPTETPATAALLESLSTKQSRLREAIAVLKSAAVDADCESRELVELLQQHRILGRLVLAESQQEIGAAEFDAIRIAAGLRNGRSALIAAAAALRSGLPERSRNLGGRALRGATTRTAVGALQPESARNAQSSHDAFRRVSAEIVEIKKRLNRRELDVAIRYMDDVIQRQIRNGESAYAAKTLCTLAEHAKSRGLYELQLEWSEKATRTSPEDARALVHFADALGRNGRYSEAINQLTSAFQLASINELYTDERGDPTSVVAVTLQASLLRQVYRFDEALETCRAAYATGARSERLSLILAECLVGANDTNAALEVMREAKELFPESARVWGFTGTVLAKARDFSAAVHAFSEAERKFPHDPYAFTQRGAFCTERGLFEEADAALKLAISLSPPSDKLAHTAFAMMLFSRGKYERVLDFVLPILEDDAEERVLAGVGVRAAALAPQGDCANSVHRLGRSRARPYDFDLQRALLAFDSQAKPLTDAQLNYARFVEQYPWHFEIRCDYADLLRRSSAFDQAEHHYRDVIERVPNHGRANRGLRLLLEDDGPPLELGDQGPRDGAFLLAEDYEARLNAGIAAVASSELRLAQRLLTNVEKHSPYKPIRRRARLLLGVVLSALSRFAQAEARLKDADAAELRALRGYVAYRCGAVERAQRYFGAAESAGIDDSLLARLQQEARDSVSTKLGDRLLTDVLRAVA